MFVFFVFQNKSISSDMMKKIRNTVDFTFMIKLVSYEGKQFKKVLWYFFSYRKALFNETTGHVKRAGDIYKLPKLAETMRILAKEGAEALYNGSLTQVLLEEIKKIDGIITAEDLANYK